MGPAPHRGAGRACEEWVDALVERSLGPGEGSNPELDRHLAECRDCAEYLIWLSPAADVLAEAVPSRNPSSELKRRVMSEVRADAKQAGAHDPSLWERLVPRPRLAVAGLAAAAALAGAVAVATIDETSAPVEAAPVIALGPGSPIEGELVREGNNGLLRLRGLPRLGSDRVYQVWVRRGEALAPSTVFIPDRTREAEPAISGGLEGADEVLVTAEPPGGSAVPTTDPIARAPLS